MNRRRKRAVVFCTEIVIGVLLITAVVALSAMAFAQFGKMRQEYSRRQVLAYAAQSQLARLAAGAELDSSPPPGVVDDRVQFRTETTPMEGDWSGCQRVEVTASMKDRENTYEARAVGMICDPMAEPAVSEGDAQ